MDNGKLFVPRLGMVLNVSSIKQAITRSIQELGYEEPTPDQEEVVLKFVGGRDVFVSLPTGSGKSVCFACTPLVFDKLRRLKQVTANQETVNGSSVTIVLSPLNALMEDQVSKFSSRGLQAAFVSGEEEKQSRILSGSVQLVYFSPEALISIPFWRELFKAPYYRNNIICLAIDEAHLVEKWYVFVIYLDA